MVLRKHPINNMQGFMKEALAEAHQAARLEEVPIGAIIVYKDQIIARAGNRPKTDKDPTAHAEILAIRAACHALGNERLSECDLYVTLEPCPLCAQAISFARIRRLYFGGYDPKGGGVDHGPRIFDHRTCHHRPEVIGGILEEDCSQILKTFFRNRR